MKILSSIAILSSLEAVTAGKHKHQKAKALKEHSLSVPETLRGGKEKKAKVHKELSLSLPEGFKGDKHKKKAKVHKPLSLSLPDAATGGKPKKAKGHKDFSLSLPVNVRGHKHREKKFENALITRKSLKPHGFGPKHKVIHCLIHRETRYHLSSLKLNVICRDLLLWLFVRLSYVTRLLRQYYYLMLTQARDWIGMSSKSLILPL